MKCPRCQHDNPRGARFCEECATPLARTCSSCGMALSAAAKFCHACAHPVAAAPGAPSRAPDSYTPKHLAERIINSKAALEGERKQVTVLFADLKGSMELLADRDPEEARKILDPVLEQMMESVHRYEGTVNQVMGDGIMALFGAPLAHEDHAVRACYAALRMQQSVKKYAEEVRRSHAAAVKIRVGLNSGEVVVRAIGSDLHMDYTAVGQTTHLAARMEQLADPGAIVITPPTLALAEGYIEVRSLGSVPVKGLADAVAVYEVTGAGSARSRLHASARRGLSRFVGRDAELEELRRAQQLAGSGHGQVAAIVGEAGVGKSRLVYEFTHSHRLHGWLTLEAASVSYGKATSYLPVIDLLKAYFKIQDRDDVREIREKVTGRLLTLDRALEPTLPAVLSLLDIPVDDLAWQALDPAQRRQRTLDAVKGLLLREARERPLLVIFEDLHWIDDETQALLDSLVESLGSARLLLLVNCRPEYQHAWSGKTSYNQMRLDALPVEGAGELLQALLGDDPGLAPLKQILVRRGNPFFLEETVRTLVETKALAGERGRYRLMQPVQAIQVPPTVQVMLSARVDRLSPEDKRLLQVASVIGKDLPFALLQAIAELPDEALRHGLDHLQAAEFLYETGLYPDLEYSFKHALTHEVTYGGLLHERQRELHARIVEAVEQLYADRLPEHVERLGYHAVRGALWEKAATYLRQAGAKAIARSANREALAALEGTLTALAHLPESRERIEVGIDLRLEIRNARYVLGEHDKTLVYLLEAEQLAERLGAQRVRASVMIQMSQYFWVEGDSERAVELSRQASRVAHELADPALLVIANVRLGQAYHTSGDHQRAVEVLDKASRFSELELTRFGLAGLPSVFARSWLARSLAELGRFLEGIERGDEAVRIAEKASQPYSVSFACMNLGLLYVRKGALPQAVALLERSAALCKGMDLPLMTVPSLSTLGHAYALEGRFSEALPLLEQCVAPTTFGQSARHGFPFINLGEGYLLAGRVNQAVEISARGLDYVRERRDRGLEAWALRLLAEIASHRGPRAVDAAQNYYLDGLRLATELGMHPLVAHCHLGLGKLYGRTNKREQAQEHLATATTMYREMGMTYWLEKAEAEMRELG